MNWNHNVLIDWRFNIVSLIYKWIWREQGELFAIVSDGNREEEHRLIHVDRHGIIMIESLEHNVGIYISTMLFVRNYILLLYQLYVFLFIRYFIALLYYRFLYRQIYYYNINIGFIYIISNKNTLIYSYILLHFYLNIYIYVYI